MTSLPEHKIMEDENTEGDCLQVFTITSLPHEILEVIFSFSNILISDLGTLHCVCSKFRNVICSNKIWKSKFQERWPDLLYCYKKEINYTWKEECKYRLQSGRAIRKKISGMSLQHFRDEEISNEAFDDLLQLMEDHKYGYQFAIDELMTILNDDKKDFNLTEKYYVEKALRFAKHIYLKTKWEQFLSLDTESQVPEMGTILLAQWCQPTISVRQEIVSKQLDELAWLVINEVSQKYKKHPLLELKELISMNKKLVQSAWAPAQCRSVLECLNHVLFEQLNYQGNRQNFYEADNSYLNKILERRTGNPITMCVLYASVAQRLGVLCEPVNFPSHFLLRWKEHPTLSGGQEYTYIDVFTRGRFMPERECISVLPSSFAFTQTVYEAVPTIRIFQRMAHNLVEIGRQQNNTSDCLLCLRNALELVLLLQPDDTDSRLLLVRVYLHLNINLCEVLSILQQIQATDPTRCGIVAYMFQICRTKLETKRNDKAIAKTYEVKERVSGVEFAIGMIMTHKRFNYSCVIYGWDPQCAADNDWVVQMGVNNLAKKRYQPFYHVLVNDGSNRYAAQENLEIATEPCFLTHAEIGRYFSAFKGTYYLPNDEKAKEYPEDKAARDTLIQQHYEPSTD